MVALIWRKLNMVGFRKEIILSNRYIDMTKDIRDESAARMENIWRGDETRSIIGLANEHTKSLVSLHQWWMSLLGKWKKESLSA